MMGKLADRDKRILENMFDGDVSYAPYCSLIRQQHIPSSLSKVSLQSPDRSSSSGSFSNGFCSPEDGSPDNRGGEMLNEVSNVAYWSRLRQRQQQQKFLFSGGSTDCSPSSLYTSSPSSSSGPNLLSEEANNNKYYRNVGLCFDSKSPHDSDNMNSTLVDEMGLSQSFSGMSVRDDHNGFGTKMKGFEVADSDEFGASFKKDESYGDFNCASFNIEGFKCSPHGVSLSTYDDLNSNAFSGLHCGFVKDGYDSTGSSFAHNQSNDLCSNPVWYERQSDYLLERRKEHGESTWGIRSQNPSFIGPYVDDPPSLSNHYKMDANGSRVVMDSLGSPHLMNSKFDLNAYDPLYRDLLLKERMRAIRSNGFAQSRKGAVNMEAFSCEDSFIIQGKSLNHVDNKGREPLSSDKMNSFNEMCVQNLCGKNISWEIDQRVSSFSTLPVAPSVDSLSEVQGNIYLMAQDQNGCRWLQRIFDEGTSQEIEIIFNELIDHVIELMLKPFGNYVIQKFLDVCNEEQKMQIVFMVTEEPGQLVGICLNTYGTRAAQKLIETLKTRQQISFVVSALKPGFLDLVKDQNGNHVIQRCLQCLSNEDNKFIFDAAAKFCVEIATHRHGCCVMQRCITHSTGKHRDELITEISKNALLLSQDPFGNYVVQYIIELESPSAAVDLLSQFKRHYVHLSMQKFSSHVVEKCLKHLEESREQIIHELISVSCFEQLLQDPFANYVIQSALAVTKGPLRSLLVDAVRPHVILRTNPYSKRIFSRNLLKK